MWAEPVEAHTSPSDRLAGPSYILLRVFRRSGARTSVAAVVGLGLRRIRGVLQHLGDPHRLEHDRLRRTVFGEEEVELSADVACDE